MTPRIERIIPSGLPAVPVVRVSGGNDMLRFAALVRGGSIDLGRDDDCALSLSDASVSRRHARLGWAPDGFILEDLGSRNGTLVNGAAIEREPVRSGDRIELGSVPLRIDVLTPEEVAHLSRVVERLDGADRDPLTGLLTRAYLDERLPRVLEATARNAQSLSALFVDVDRFKSINDRFGHAVGDDVLRQTSRLIAFSMRDGEVAIRYGGEELLLVLEGSDEEQAMALGERIRHGIEIHDWERVVSGLRVTISVGVAQYHGGESSRQWLGRADRALYQAKGEGRNRIQRASLLATS